MSVNILEIQNLTKKYKNKKIVDNLNITLKKGQIYGLLGKNGAGKTTTMCMITNLIQKYEGDIKIFNKQPCDKQIYNKVGSLIEYPGFYSNLTAYENMKYFQMIQNEFNDEEILELLNVVKLSEYKNMKVKKFSMGMKQRLSIAISLINNPELLILDEPINGLDPEGIKEIRIFLKNLSKDRNITILISSHILSELEKLCDKIGIINEGNLIEEININKLHQNSYNKTIYSVNKINKAIEIINDNFKIDAMVKDNKIYVNDCENTSKIINQLVSNNIEIYSVIPETLNLEQYFLNTVTNYNQEVLL